MIIIPDRVKVVVVMVSALALAAGLLTLALLAKPAQARLYNFTDTDRTSSSFLIFACTEDVFIEGTLNTVAHTTIDANGGYHSKEQFNFQGQGEGLSSGDKYVYHSVFNDHVNFTDGFNGTGTQTIKVTRQGSASTPDDSQAKILYHLTVNAQGEVTAVVNNFEFECS